MFDRYAEVAVRVPVRSAFTYRINTEIQPGQRVLVPFRNQTEEGIVISLHRNTPEYEVLDIEGVTDPVAVLKPEQIETANYISRQYLCGIGEILFKMFPSVPKRFPEQQSISRSEQDFRPNHILNSEQSAVYEAVKNSNEESVHLIQGITGSGKTEVYIHLLIECLSRNRNAILLVPEISLSFQMIQRLKSVFGPVVALLTSSLKPKERFINYMNLYYGHARIAVGTRSAVFAPVDEPGIIIIDEEHDSSFRDQSAPRYDARQVARYRVSQSKGKLILGSATPRVEARYYGTAGIFNRHTLTQRAEGQLPSVRITNAPADDIPVGGELLREIEWNLKNKQKTLLLLNRRGYRPYLVCKSCKETATCPNCSITLNLHRDGRVRCHFCGFVSNVPGKHSCGGSFRHTGSGTQKLEEYLLNLYPEARIERLDTDSAARAGVTEDVLKRFLEGEIDILTGTQMIAKGLNHPDVSLVGVLQSDRSLHFPDFRATERTFSLLMQVAGRSGRSEKTGRVIFEADDCDHPVLHLAAAQDYEAFYAEEIQLRKSLVYPPFTRLVRLLCRANQLQDSINAMDDIYDFFDKNYEQSDHNRIQLLGPVSAPVEKLNNQYRTHMIIKARKMEPLRSFLDKNLEKIRDLSKKGHLEIEFDPADLI